VGRQPCIIGQKIKIIKTFGLIGINRDVTKSSFLDALYIAFVCVTMTEIINQVNTLIPPAMEKFPEKNTWRVAGAIIDYILTTNETPKISPIVC